MRASAILYLWVRNHLYVPGGVLVATQGLQTRSRKHRFCSALQQPTAATLCRCLSSRRMSLDAGFKIGGRDKRPCQDVQPDRPVLYRRYSIGPCDPDQFSAPVSAHFSSSNVQAFRELSNVPHRCATSCHFQLHILEALLLVFSGLS